MTRQRTAHALFFPGFDQVRRQRGAPRGRDVKAIVMPVRHNDGSEKVVVQCRVTAKGLHRIAERMNLDC